MSVKILSHPDHIYPWGVESRLTDLNLSLLYYVVEPDPKENSGNLPEPDLD